MSAVLGWLKSHILIVIFGVLILVLPPAGVVGSMMWNTSIRTAAEELYADESQKLQRAGRVNYEVPAIAEGEQPVSESRAPNEVVSRAYRAERERRQAEIERVVRAAVGFNRGEGRSVLVEGLFPDPAGPSDERRLTAALLDRLAGTEDERGAYADLFAGINAGTPPEPLSVAREVTQFEERELDRMVGEYNRAALSDAQLEELDEGLVAQRISQYRRRSEEISVYGSVDALRVEPGGGFAAIPVDRPESRPGVVEAFVMQMDFWAVQDVLDAVRNANTEAGGLSTETPRSTIKRIESLRLRPLETVLAVADEVASDPTGGMAPPGFPQRGGFGGGRPAMGGMAGAAGAQAAVASSHTGRQDAESDVYDLRVIELTAVVASERIGRFIDALAATNFKTVVGMRAEEVDVWGDLEQGYYYGPEHVLRVTFTIESAWLRQWTRDAMPEQVRTALGVVLPDPIEDEPAADGGFQEGSEVAP